jgi:alkylation response protein AidB-like acyl-CoA dehydrogenase
MTVLDSATELLTDDMLARFDERAPQYDRENRFFAEDFEELRASGYLRAPIPLAHGGPGLGLADVNRLQRRLAYHAAPTALAVNMHLYWIGMAADLARMGDPSGEWLLRRAGEGAIFAAGHAESGNDLQLMLSTTRADRVEGGWRVHGHKQFGSLSPVWTYLGLHAMDSADPAGPRVVHGFLHRETPDFHIEETWDTLGMRATASHDTILEGAFVPDEAVMLVCPTGFAGVGPFHAALFAWALLGFAAVYLGQAQRAYDEIVRQLPRRTSLALTRSMAYHPEMQHLVADMRIALEAAEAHLDRVVDDWTNGVDHGAAWPIKIVAARHAVIERCWHVVDTALDASGGAGIFKRTRLEQIVRDARLGRIHPTSGPLTHELIGKLALGIDPDEGLRWG